MRFPVTSSCERKLIRNSLLNSNILGAILVFSYLAVYGISAQLVLTGAQLLYFLGSIAFAICVFYIRDPEMQKKKVRKGILFNQIVGTFMIFAYVMIYGISSITLLSGFQLIFFMSSYVFAMSVIYVRSPERLQSQDNVSFSHTNNNFLERSPCIINSNDLSWLVRTLNSSLSIILGFAELLLKRTFSESEKEFMVRNIYEQGLTMSNAINKVSKIEPDELVKPKEVYEVADLLADKNFK